MIRVLSLCAIYLTLFCCNNPENCDFEFLFKQTFQPPTYPSNFYEKLENNNFSKLDGFISIRQKYVKDECEKFLLNSLAAYYYQFINPNNEKKNRFLDDLSKNSCDSYEKKFRQNNCFHLIQPRAKRQYVTKKELAYHSKNVIPLNTPEMSNQDSLIDTITTNYSKEKEIKLLPGKKARTAKKTNSNTRNDKKEDNVKIKDEFFFVYKGELGSLIERNVQINKKKKKVQIKKDDLITFGSNEYNFIISELLENNLNETIAKKMSSRFAFLSSKKGKNQIDITLDLEIEDFFLNNFVELQKEKISIEESRSLLMKLIKEYKSKDLDLEVENAKKQLNDLEKIEVNKELHFKNLHERLFKKQLNRALDDYYISNKVSLNKIERPDKQKKNLLISIAFSLKYSDQILKKSSYEYKLVSNIVNSLSKAINDFCNVNNLDAAKLEYDLYVKIRNPK